MADIDIPQAEADALIAMEKQCVENKTWLFPEPGGRLAIALASPDSARILFSTSPALRSSLRKPPIRTGRGRPLSSCDLTSTARRTEIPTIRKSHVHICISTANVTPINGLSRHRLTDTRMCKTCFLPSRLSCDTATLRSRLKSIKGFSHERGRDRKTPERLPGMAER